jgi:hypothetical protein
VNKARTDGIRYANRFNQSLSSYVPVSLLNGIGDRPTLRGENGFCIPGKVLDWKKSYGDGVRHNRSG